MSTHYEPNQPIVMPYRRITCINGKPTDIEARVVQNLWPQSHVSIESAYLPPEILTDSRPCRIILDHNQMNINVIPSPDSGYLISHNAPKGSLFPIVSPVLSVNPIMKLRSARFAVANFSRFYGSTDRWVNGDNSTKRSGTTILTEEPWRLQIHALPNIDSILDTIASTNGRAVTHIGKYKELTDSSSLQEKPTTFYQLCGHSYLSSMDVTVAWRLPTGQINTDIIA